MSSRQRMKLIWSSIAALTALSLIQDYRDPRGYIGVVIAFLTKYAPLPAERAKKEKTEVE